MVHFTGSVPAHIQWFFQSDGFCLKDDNLNKIYDIFKQSLSFAQHMQFEPEKVIQIRNMFKNCQSTNTTIQFINSLCIQLLFKSLCKSDQIVSNLWVSTHYLNVTNYDAWLLIHKAPPEKRTVEWIKEIMFFVDQFSPSDFSDLPYDELETIIAITRPLIRLGSKDGDCKFSREMIDDVRKIPAPSRQEWVTQIHTYLQKCKDIKFVRESITWLMFAVTRVPAEQVDEKLFDLILYLTKYTEKGLLSQLRRIQHHMGYIFFSNLFECYQCNTSSIIVDFVSKVTPYDLRETKLKDILQLYLDKYNPDYENLEMFFTTLQDVPITELKDFLDKVYTLMNRDINNNAVAFIEQVEFLLSRSIADRENLVALCSSRCNVDLIIDAFNEIPVLLFTKILPVIKQYCIKSDSACRPRLIYAVTKIVSQGQEGIFTEFHQYFSKMRNERVLVYFFTVLSMLPNASDRHTISLDDLYKLHMYCANPDEPEYIEALTLIAPDMRVAAIHVLLEHLEFLGGDILANLFKSVPNMYQTSLVWLARRLESQVENRAETWHLSSAIMRNTRSLGLEDNTSLYKTAEVYKIISDPNELKSKKNPYRIHKVLREALKEPPPTLELASFTMGFPLQFADASLASKLEKVVTVHPENLRAKCDEYTLRFSDLPSGVSGYSLTEMCEVFLKRCEGLPQEQLIALNDRIKNLYGHNPSTLFQFLLKPIMKHLFAAKGAPEDPLPEPEIAYVYAIVKAMQETSTLVSPETGLSPQEEFIFNFTSLALAECPTGERDGIRGYYNQLDIKYRISGKIVDMGYKEHVNGLAFHAVQKTLGGVFQGTQWLESLLGGQIPEKLQLSHHAFYLQNRFSHLVGYQHCLRMDPNIGWVRDELLFNTDTKIALTSFFTICTPTLFIQDLRLAVTQGIVNEKKTIDENLQKVLLETRSTVTDEAVIRAIDTALQYYFKGEKRLAYAVVADPYLRALRREKKWPIQAKIQDSLTEYMSGIIPAEIKDKEGWLENYLEITDDDEISGVTQLGALEILTEAGYFQLRAAKRHREAVEDINRG